jgi:hypothetical protein
LHQYQGLFHGKPLNLYVFVTIFEGSLGEGGIRFAGIQALLSGWKPFTCSFPDFALTPLGANHTISPESSDGLASVGTILPKRKSRPVAGRLFRVFE